MNTPKRLLSMALCASVLHSSLISPAHAGLISTETFERTQQSQGQAAGRVRLDEALARSDVQAALQQQGVSQAAVRERIAALSDDEAAQLAEQIHSAPAGGIVGEIVFVFFVLLITDILGFTKVYPFTRPAR